MSDLVDTIRSMQPSDDRTPPASPSPWNWPKAAACVTFWIAACVIVWLLTGAPGVGAC